MAMPTNGSDDIVGTNDNNFRRRPHLILPRPLFLEATKKPDDSIHLEYGFRSSRSLSKIAIANIVFYSPRVRPFK